MLWRRPDGELVRDLPPTKGIVPYLMRGRNESAVYFEQQVAMRHADAYIREFNVAHPDTPITIQHLLMWAIAQILEQHPTMNRFVVGGRLYQRNDIWSRCRCAGRAVRRRRSGSSSGAARGSARSPTSRGVGS